jgi:predicted membrane metal-binding protein
MLSVYFFIAFILSLVLFFTTSNIYGSLFWLVVASFSCLLLFYSLQFFPKTYEGPCPPNHAYIQDLCIRGYKPIRQ